MYKVPYSILAALVACALLCSGCISGDEAQEPTTLPSGESAVDGIVYEDEYDNAAALSGSVTLYWEVEGDILKFAMRARTDGMVSIGFNPTQGMKDADMIIGWVSSGGTVAYDCYATGATGPHPEDTSLGGTEDIVAYAGTEAGGITTLEVARLLASGDPYDASLEKGGQVRIIWAISGSDDFNAVHSARGDAEIVID